MFPSNLSEPTRVRLFRPDRDSRSRLFSTRKLPPTSSKEGNWGKSTNPVNLMVRSPPTARSRSAVAGEKVRSFSFA